jgi:hypothetical protein
MADKLMRPCGNSRGLTTESAWGTGPSIDNCCILSGAGDKGQGSKKRRLVDSAVDAVPGMPILDVQAFETLVQARTLSTICSRPLSDIDIINMFHWSIDSLIVC